MKADAQTQSEVMNVLVQAHEAYARRDVQGLLAHFVPDSDVIMLGTGPDEKRVGLAEIRAQAERDWAQTDASSLQFGWHSVSVAGSVACVATDATFNVTAGGETMAIPARMTATLEKRGDKWLVLQAHYSIPWGDQAEGESFPSANE